MGTVHEVWDTHLEQHDIGILGPLLDAFARPRVSAVEEPESTRVNEFVAVRVGLWSMAHWEPLEIPVCSCQYTRFRL